MHPSACNRLALPAALAVALLLPAAGAMSATVTRVPLQNAVADCQGSLPSFEGSFRKRPTGIANEGASPAFLTCSMQADESASGNARAAITFRNTGTAAATVGCTLVTNTVNSPTYFTKSISVAPGAGTTHVVWTPDDNGGEPFDSHINFNCQVPAGVEANYTYREFEENVGE